MRTVSKRDLNQQTASVLSMVTPTEPVIVTERGKPRWLVTQVREADSILNRLERDGLYSPPTSSPTPWPPHPGGRAYSEAEFTELLDEVRGEH